MIKIFLLTVLSLSLWSNIGSVMVIKGKAELNRTGEMLEVVSAMELMRGDEILTKAKTRVQIMLNDDTVVTIGPKSSFSFEEFDFDGTSNSKVSMKAKRGFFRSVTGQIGKVAPERFKVKTASATIGIRGTDFSGDISTEREILKCYSGEIFVEYNGASQDVPAGMMLELTPKKVELKEIPKLKSKNNSNDNKQIKEKTKESSKTTTKYEQKDEIVKASPARVSEFNSVTEDSIEVKDSDVHETETTDILDSIDEVIVEDIESVEVAIEDVADVTIDEVVTQIESVIEPFEITPGIEDR